MKPGRIGVRVRGTWGSPESSAWIVPWEWIMKMIVGLGNPGRSYARTRHNVGANVVLEAARHLGVSLDRGSMQAEWGRGKKDDLEFLLVLPMTYMNLSGQAVSALARYFKIPDEEILVVVDDLNLALGKLRFRSEGSAGGHNGLKSIIELLGRQAFHRLRIGIGAPAGVMQVTDFVLGTFFPEELPVMDAAVKRAAEAAVCWLEKGMAPAMRLYNG
jgi:PTH1 family peptidyl-tRNA hydrolase